MYYSLRLLAALLGIISSPILAQECNLHISGQVIDQHDGKPLSFAEVYIKELGRGTVVDSSGFYHLNLLCPGSYTLVASHIGCKPVLKTIELRTSRDSLNFYPEHHTEMLAEARIIEVKKRNSAEARADINDQQIELSRGKPLDALLKNASGVNVVKNGHSIIKPVIHGLYGNRVVTLNNGIQQEDQQWGLEHGLNIDLFTADEVTVIKGASGVRYGAGAVGGVLQLTPAKLPFGNNNLGGKAYLLGLSNGRGGVAALRLERGISNQWAARIQLSGQVQGDQRSPDYVLTNTGMRQWNAAVSIGHKTQKWENELYYSSYRTELGILRSAHIGNKTDLDSAIARNEPFYQEPFSYAINNPRQEITHHLAKASFRYKPTNLSLYKLVYGFQKNQRKEFDVNRDSDDESPANNLHLSTHTLELSLDKDYSKRLSVAYGLSGLLQINTNIPGTNIRPLLPNYNRYQAGAFSTLRYQTNSWLWETGLRYDGEYILVQKFNSRDQLIRPDFTFHNLAASAGMTHYFNSNWQLSTLLAYTFRPPHVNELMSEGLHHGAATIEVGDSTLTPESSLNWSNTLTINYPGSWKMEITAYLNPFKNYIYLNPQQEVRATIRGAFPVQVYTQDDVLLMGTDLQLRVFLTSRLEYDLTGNYVRGINRSDNNDLVLMPPPQAVHGIIYRLPQLRSLKNNFIRLSQKLVARQRHYPKDADLAPPPQGYSLLGVSIGTELARRNNQQWAFSLSIENLLNTGYRDYLDRFRYFADQAGINVQLKIKYEF